MVATITQSLLNKLPPGTYDVRDRAKPAGSARSGHGEHSYLVRIGKGTRRRWFTLGRAACSRRCGPARWHTKSWVTSLGAKIPSVTAGRRTPSRLGLSWNARTPALGACPPEDRQIDRGAHCGPILAAVREEAPRRDYAMGGREVACRSAARPERGSPATVNRDLVALKACLSKAVQWKVIPQHPLRDVKRSKDDRAASGALSGRGRREATQSSTRHSRRRPARCTVEGKRLASGAWLSGAAGARNIATDHLTPIVLLALNTGLRRGELFNLSWPDINLARRNLTVEGEGAKSGRTRHVPLNNEALQVLGTWGPTTDLVFPGDEGLPMTTLKTSWLKLAKDANLNDFRFHNLRHTFASKLVQRGVDLNTVRELLGHSDFSLTLRYAHLAAENKAAAVAKLA